MDYESFSQFVNQSDDFFTIFNSSEGVTPVNESVTISKDGNKNKSTSSNDTKIVDSSQRRKRPKLAGTGEGKNKMCHITVERTRRKQMKEHLGVLRSLMPSFYFKRGDQASIIGGVIDYIKEMQQILQSLESKKQRKLYTEILSPKTPTPISPYYNPRLNNGYLSPTMVASSLDLSPSSSSTTTANSWIDNVNDPVVANSKSDVADVEVRFSGKNLVLKTVSHHIPGQVMKVIAAIEDLLLEILQANINIADQTMLNTFTIKIGTECQFSAEELACQIQQTFC